MPMNKQYRRSGAWQMQNGCQMTFEPGMVLSYTYGWAKDGVEPTVFEAQGLKWLHFAQVDGDDVHVKLFNTSICTWTKVPVGHVITLQCGDHIFLKALNVSECVTFDALLASSEHTDPHISKNLPRECAFVQHALAAKQDTFVEVLGSDNEIDDVTPVPCQFKCPPSHPLCKFSQTHTSGPLSVCVKVEPMDTGITVKEEIDLTITDDEDLPVPSRKRLLSTSSAGSLYRHSPSPSDQDQDDDANIRVWPANFYTLDIVCGFDKCEQARRAQQGVGKAFTAVFQVPFCSTTYYNHRQNWELAPQCCRDKALAAGHTPDGLWTTFLNSSRQEERRVKKRTKA
ncbi:hypothetical protein F5887DRAFT_1072023 [Amanita rubescens]|nr:hypothetical protein F5887DRAFT_1072023 [Amanita rubescens]